MTKEVTANVIDEVKSELNEYYHDHLEEPISKVASFVPSLTGNSNQSNDKKLLTANDLLNAHKHELWETFVVGQQINDNFSEAHQAVIIRNDPNLDEINQMLVPDYMDKPTFWLCWRFLIIFLKGNRESNGFQLNGTCNNIDKMNKLSVDKMVKLNSPKCDEEWEEWE